MNRYHQNHPDPEIRKKYADWRNAMDGYQARSLGFNDSKEMAEATKTQKEGRRNIAAILSQVRRPAKQAKKQLRRTAQRGA